MQNINVNIVPGSFLQTLRYSQGDVGRQFKVNLVDYEIPSGATAQIRATKPSGLGFVASGTISGNSITFVTTADMTDEAGRFKAEIRITSGSTILGTANIIFDGEEDPHPDGTIDGTQGSIVPELTALVNRIEAAADSIHDLNVAATTLEPNQSATATYNSSTNTITFGIPRAKELQATDDGNGNVTLAFN